MRNFDCECQGKTPGWCPGLIAVDVWVRMILGAMNRTVKVERWRLVKNVPSRQFPD
jgi:hypothetical protein